jgi:threonylcarbamoyladenosine tRNA methylthiotransferase MtaB
MRRRYLTALYSEKINKIRALMPHCCIGVDVIVGFPGETEKDFMDTFNFIRDLDISYLHVFTYSERDDTLAASLPEAVPASVRKERNKMLRILSDKKLRAFYEKQIGTERNVLFEADNKSGWMHGFTDNYIKVRTPYNKELINRIAKCRIESVTPECEAEIVVLDFVQENECV